MTTYWTGRSLAVAFAVLAVLSLVAVVATLGGGLMELVYGAVGGAVVGAVVVGSYALGKRRGQPHSHAVATAAIMLGIVYTIAVVARLLTEFGA